MMIQSWLTDIEHKYGIDILFAVEAGSRAWGGATSQSDHDIRFIYKSQDVRSYLSLGKALETLDIPAPYDVQGWDLFKAFQLLEKSNGSLLEWAGSPIVFRDHNSFSHTLKNFIEESYSLFTLYQHYIHLMARNLKDVQSKEFTEKRQKKLIHAVRSYLLAKDILENQRVPFHVLYSSFPANPYDKKMGSFYHELMNAKGTGRLINKGSVEEILLMIENERSSLDQKAVELPHGKDIRNKLNEWIWTLLDV